MPETLNTPVNPNLQEMQEIIKKLRGNNVPDERISAYLKHRFGKGDDTTEESSDDTQVEESSDDTQVEESVEEKKEKGPSALEVVNAVRAPLFATGYKPVGEAEETPAITVGAESVKIPLDDLEKQIEKESSRVESMIEKYGKNDRRVLRANYNLKKKRQQLSFRQANPDKEPVATEAKKEVLPKELENLMSQLKEKGKDDEFIQEVKDLWLMQDSGIISEERHVAPEDLPTFNPPLDWDRPLNSKRVNYKLVESPALGFSSGTQGNIVPFIDKSPLVESLKGDEFGKKSGNFATWSEYSEMSDAERSQWLKDYHSGKVNLPLGESMLRSSEQAVNRLRTIDDRLNYAIGSLIGDIGFTKGSYQYIKRNVKDLEEIKEISGPTHQFTDIPGEDNIKGKAIKGLGATFNAITSVGTSLVENRIPYLLAADMISQSVYDAAEAKAEELGISVEELGATGQADLIEPIILGTGAHQLEKLGLKGIEKYIKALPSGTSKKLLNLFYNGNTEGTTEVFQGAIEAYNVAKAKALGQGLSQEEATKIAAKASGDFLTSKDALESYLQGFVGSSGTSVIGAATSRRNNGDKIEQNLDKQSELKGVISNPNATEQDISIASDAVDNLESELEEEIKEPYRDLAYTTEEEIGTLAEVSNKISELESKKSEIEANNNLTEDHKSIITSRYNEEISKLEEASSQLITESIERQEEEDKGEIDDVKKADKIEKDLSKIEDKRKALTQKENSVASAENPNPATTQSIKGERSDLDKEEKELNSQKSDLRETSIEALQNSKDVEEAINKVEESQKEKASEIYRDPIQHINDKFPNYKTDKEIRGKKEAEKKRKAALAKRKYKIYKSDDGYVVVNDKGTDANTATRNKYLSRAVEEGDINIPFGKDVSELGLTKNLPSNKYTEVVAEKSQDPSEVAQVLETTKDPKLKKSLENRFKALTGLEYAKNLGSAVIKQGDVKGKKGIVDEPLEVIQQREKEAAEFEKFSNIALQSKGKVVLTSKKQVNLALINSHKSVSEKILNREYKGNIEYDGKDTYTTENVRDAYNIKGSANKRGIDAWVVEKNGANKVVLATPFAAEGLSGTIDEYLNRFQNWLQKKYDEAPRGGELYSTIIPIPSSKAFLGTLLDAIKLVRKPFKKSKGIEKGIQEGYELLKNSDLTEEQWRTLVYNIATESYNRERESLLNDFLGQLDVLYDKVDFVDNTETENQVRDLLKDFEGLRELIKAKDDYEDFDFDQVIGNSNLLPIDLKFRKEILSGLSRLSKPHHHTEYVPDLLKGISDGEAFRAIAQGMSRLYSEYNDILTKEERYLASGRSSIAVSIGSPLITNEFVDKEVLKITKDAKTLRKNKDVIGKLLEAEEQRNKDGKLIKKFKPLHVKLSDGSSYRYHYAKKDFKSVKVSESDKGLFDSFERKKGDAVKEELGDKYPLYLDYLQTVYKEESDAQFDKMLSDEANIESLQNVLNKSIRNRAAFKLGMHYLNFMQNRGLIDYEYLGGFEPYRIKVLNESKMDKFITAGRVERSGRKDSSVPLSEPPIYGDNEFYLNGTPLISKASDWQQDQDLSSAKAIANANGKVPVYRNTKYLKKLLLVQNHPRFTMENKDIEPESKLAIQRQRILTFIDFMEMGDGPNYLQTFFSNAGREFYASTHVNPQGTKLAVGGLHTEPIPLGRKGLFNLMAQVGAYAGATGSTAELVKHTIENLKNYTDMYNNSTTNTGWLEGEIDKPELWLDSIGELVEALKSGDPLSYETGIPIHYDASTSGAQQNSMLLEDAESGATVNISLDKAFQDLYNKVGNKYNDDFIKPLIDSELFKKSKKIEVKITDKLGKLYKKRSDAVKLDPKNEKERKASEIAVEKAEKDIKDYIISIDEEDLQRSARIFASENFLEELRDFAKSPVMVALYGAGAGAVAKGLLKKFREIPGFTESYANFIASDLIESVKETSPALIGLLTQLREIGAVAYKLGKVVRFVGPNGFPTEINPTIPLVSLVSTVDTEGKKTSGTVTTGSGITSFGKLFKQIGPLIVQSTDPQMLSELTSRVTYPILKTHDDVSAAAGHSGNLEVDIKTALAAPFKSMRTYDDAGKPTGNYLHNIVTQILGEDRVKFISNKDGNIIRFNSQTVEGEEATWEDIKLGDLDTDVAQYNEHAVSIGSTSNIEPGELLPFVLPSEERLKEMLLDLGEAGSVDRVTKSATVFIKNHTNIPYYKDKEKC